MVFLRWLPVFVLSGAAFASDVQLLEQIIAKVNGDIVTTSEVERGRRQLAAELKRGGASAQQLEKALKEREKDILRDRIDQLLLVQKGKELNINVDSEVTKYLAGIQLQNKIADQDKFQQWVRDQFGMPFEDVKAEVRNNFLTRRVIGQEVQSRINISRTEARKYYDEHKDEFVREERVFLREILISTQEKAEGEIPALEKKAKDLVARARAGERFSDLSRDNSDSESSKAGGEVGAFKKDLLPKDIADVVFSHEKGYVTDAFKVANGFLILQVEERHQAGLAPFEEVENEVMSRLYEPRFDPAMREYLTMLRTEAFLEIRDGFTDTGAAPGKDTSWRNAAELKPATVTREEVIMSTRRRRLLWMVPIPGTKIQIQSTSER